MSPALKACGQDDLAKDFELDLPTKCINSLNKFGKTAASYL